MATMLNQSALDIQTYFVKKFKKKTTKKLNFLAMVFNFIVIEVCIMIVHLDCCGFNLNLSLLIFYVCTVPFSYIKEIY